jgi:glycerol-3-phosphate acyltransferase PlsY
MFEPIATNVLLASIAFGYFFGSIPFGLLLTRIFGHGDVRDIGSGNIGATNVLRTGNKALAAGTLAADMLKGTIPAVFAMSFGETAAIVAGFSAFIGHILPVWLRFKGGKGVATFIGVQIGLYWPVAITFLAVWLVVAMVYKYSSLSALVSSAVAPLAALAFGQPPLAIAFAIIAAIIFYTHRANIARLRNREESKITLGS